MAKEGGEVPVLKGPTSLYQLVVLQYLSELKIEQVPERFAFLQDVEGVCFALCYSCLCAVDKEQQMVGYYRVPEKKREWFKQTLQGQITTENYMRMIKKAIKLMMHQAERYHTMCAKLPPELAEKEDKIAEMKAKFGAEHVFRGPRLEDGRVRMIFQVPAADDGPAFIEKLGSLGFKKHDNQESEEDNK